MQKVAKAARISKSSSQTNKIAEVPAACQKLVERGCIFHAAKLETKQIANLNLLLETNRWPDDPCSKEIKAFFAAGQLACFSSDLMTGLVLNGSISFKKACNVSSEAIAALEENQDVVMTCSEQGLLNIMDDFDRIHFTKQNVARLSSKTVTS